MNTEKLQQLSEEALAIEDKKAIRMLNLVISIFVFTLVSVAGYSGYRHAEGTNLPWSVWIPPLILGAIGTVFAVRRLFNVKKEITSRTNNN